MQGSLRCPNCEVRILSSDINIDKLVAKCHACHSVFSFEEKLQIAEHKQPEILLPPGIEAYTTPSELNIVINWKNSSGSFLTIFTIIWNVFLLPFLYIAITSGELKILLFLSIHLLVGIGLLYNMIATFVNKTHINVDRIHLLIEHGPIKMPTYKNQDIPITDLEQVFVKKYSTGRQNGRPVFAFSVNVVLTSQRTLTIAKGLKHPDLALYIEQQIERFLEIKDRRVEEEWEGH